MGVANDEIDFIYDTGTVSGVMGPKERKILFNVENENVLIETVTGERSISKEFGDTMFGKPEFSRVEEVLCWCLSTLLKTCTK
jgi:hypothetical protein